jgi:hypothetical protein
MGTLKPTKILPRLRIFLASNDFVYTPKIMFSSASRSGARGRSNQQGARSGPAS